MKTSLLFITVLLCSTSCYFLEDAYINRAQRRDTHNRDSTLLKPQDPELQDSVVSPLVDTSFYFSAVGFGKSYNWQQDSAYKAEEYTITYYKNYEELFSIKSGLVNCISPDADTHHIIQGALYTEASDDNFTYIGKNGKTIISFEGREYLKGLFPTKDGIYTLSCNRDSEGFTLRKDGETIFRRDDGVIFGSFEDPSYGPHGALYLDEARVHFCYKTGNGKTSKYFVVQDGKEKVLREQARDIDDIKFHNGICYYCPQNLKGYSIIDGRTWTIGSRQYVSGRFCSETSGESFYGFCPATGKEYPTAVCKEEAYLYLGGNNYYSIYCTSSSTHLACGDGSRTRFEDCYLPRADCAAVFDENIIVGMSRKTSQGPALIYKDGSCIDINLHGYISAVSVHVSITN